MVMTAEERKASRKATVAKYNAKSSVKLSKAKWALENKESERVRGAKYRAENKEKVKFSGKKFRLANKEKEAARSAKYRAENKEKEVARKVKWVLENKEKVRLYNANYRAENKSNLYAKNSIRRAKKFGATIYMTKEDKAKIAELYTIAKDATKLFGYGWEVDHIVPLNKGGLHKLSNLQVVPATWNAAKGDRNCDTYWD